MQSELRQEDIGKLYESVQQAVREAEQEGVDPAIKLGRFAGGMVERAVAVAQSCFETTQNNECGTGYRALSYEYIVWALAFLSEAWVSENFRRKTSDGHCWTHKQATGQPCHTGSRFHADLHTQCLNSFGGLLEVARSMPLQVVQE